MRIARKTSYYFLSPSPHQRCIHTHTRSSRRVVALFIAPIVVHSRALCTKLQFNAFFIVQFSLSSQSNLSSIVGRAAKKVWWVCWHWRKLVIGETAIIIVSSDVESCLNWLIRMQSVFLNPSELIARRRQAHLHFLYIFILFRVTKTNHFHSFNSCLIISTLYGGNISSFRSIRDKELLFLDKFFFVLCMKHKKQKILWPASERSAVRTKKNAQSQPQILLIYCFLFFVKKSFFVIGWLSPRETTTHQRQEPLMKKRLSETQF